MHVNFIDTKRTYERILAAPDAAARAAIFRDEIIAPFEPVTQVFGGGSDPVSDVRAVGHADRPV